MRSVVFAAIVGVVALLPAVAGAEEPKDAASVDTARSHFNEGSAHFHAGRWEPALAAFQRSRALVDSPNTVLMIARSLRELGRNVEAVEAFQQAAALAGAKVANGEAKYTPTERAASDEGRRLRSMLGSVRIRVLHREGAVVTVDGRAVVLDGAGEATVLHEPGSATVLVRDGGGAEQRQVVTVLAGSTLETEFAGEAAPRTMVLQPKPVTPTTPPSDAAPAWVLPAAITSGVLALAGTGVFVGFGASSRSRYDALQADCGPDNCGAAQRAEADAGKREQLIANVGLGVGVLAAAATVTFVVIGLTSRSRL